MSNTLFVLLDGMEDDPNPELGGRKPYEVAHMPFIRSNVKTRGFTTGRSYTHIFLNEMLTGRKPVLQRAVLEAMGLGMEVKPGRVAFRLSPARIRDGIIHWAYDTDTFCDVLQETVRKHMGILRDRNPEIRFFISSRAIITMDCDEVPELPGPPKDAPYVDVPGDMGRLVRAVAKDLDGLTDYPWGCGTCSEQHPHFEKLDNLMAFSNSPTSLGICRSLGYEAKYVGDIEDRIRIASEHLEHGNVFLHLDEIDEYSHMRNHTRKREILEYMDGAMSRHFDENDRIFYFVDHGTSSITGEHLEITVPFWSNFDTGVEDGEMVPLDSLIDRIL